MLLFFKARFATSQAGGFHSAAPALAAEAVRTKELEHLSEHQHFQQWLSPFMATLYLEMFLVLLNRFRVEEFCHLPSI